jgi:hypothetical protein
MTDEIEEPKHPIPKSVLALLRHRYVLPNGYCAFDRIFHGQGEDEAYRRDRQRDPAYYFYREGGPAWLDMTHKEAKALVRQGVYAGTAEDRGDCVMVNEHSQHALEDFCRSVYGSWALYLKRLALAQRACPHPSPRSAP